MRKRERERERDRERQWGSGAMLVGVHAPGPHKTLNHVRTHPVAL